MKQLWVFFLIFCASFLITGLLRKYALAKQLIDVPNERSSHSNPTPRGGGASIVITFVVGIVYLWLVSFLCNDAFVGLSIAGGVVALIGFIDDHGHIAARWRILGHFLAASWLLFWLGGLPPLVFWGFTIDFGWAGQVFTAIALVWLLNLYNFMDGIDGLAGVEALSSTLIVAVLFLFVIDDQAMLSLSLLMFVSVSGFLVWNFPPAKIFMGDVGSGFLGLALGGLALYSVQIEAFMFWVWMILLGVFVVDATYTLLRRLMRGDKIYEAHCSHAYQYASRKYGSHLYVTLAVLAINLLWLAPIACIVANGLIDGVTGVFCAYIPLLFLVWYYHAGELPATKKKVVS